MTEGTATPPANEIAAVTALIVDDEVLARRRLRRLLDARSDVTVIGECKNGQDAVQAIRAEKPGVLFLDVQMPGLDGVGVLEEVGVEAVGAVIFVTAYNRYALRAFDLHAVDYLLKPFTDARFAKALDRALSRLRRSAAESLSARLLATLEEFRATPLSLQVQSEREAEGVEVVEPDVAPEPSLPNSADRQGSQRLRGTPIRLDRLKIKSLGRTRLVRTDEIDWIEAAGSYVRLHIGKTSQLLRDSLSHLDERLPQDTFLRIHRSTIVNVHRVVELLPHGHREMFVVLEDGTRLKLSRSFRDRAERFFG